MLKNTICSLSTGLLLTTAVLATENPRLARASNCTFGFGGTIDQANITVSLSYIVNHQISLLVNVTATPAGAGTAKLGQRLTEKLQRNIQDVLEEKHAQQKSISRYQSSVDVLTQAFAVASTLSFTTIKESNVGPATVQPLRSVLKNVDAFIAIIRTIGTNKQCSKTIQARTQALVESLAPPGHVALEGTLLEKVLAGTPLEPTRSNNSTDLINVGYGIKLGADGGAGGGFSIGPQYEVGGGFNIGIPGTGIGGGFSCS